MIKILILCLLPVFAHAQLDKAIDDKFKSFASTLDSAVVIEQSGTGLFTIDTLPCAINTTASYLIRLTGKQGTKTVTMVQLVFVTNDNGVYSTQITNQRSLTGNAALTWTLNQNGLPILRVQSSGAKVFWSYKRLNI